MTPGVRAMTATVAPGWRSCPRGRGGWPAWITGPAALALTQVRERGSAAGGTGRGRPAGGAFAAAALVVVPALVLGLLVGARFRTIGDAADATTRDRLAMSRAPSARRGAP
jgi:hypothetical protein